VNAERDDEIDQSSAPLIDHLIELRSRLMWALAGFFVAFLVCFFFANCVQTLVFYFQEHGYADWCDWSRNL